MANDKSTNFTDSTLPPSAALPKADSLSAGYLSYLNDDLGKEWERDLLTDPAGLYKAGREQTRETLNLLWNTGDLAAARMSSGDLTAFPKLNASAAPADPGEPQPSSTAGTSTAAPRPGQNTAPRGTSQPAGRSASSYRTATATTAAPRPSQSAAPRSSSSTRFGESATRPRYNTYGSTRTSSGRNTAARPKARILPTLFRIFAIIIIMNILISAVSYVLLRRPFTNKPGNSGPGNITPPSIEDITIPNIEDILGTAGNYENPYPDGTVLTQFGEDFSDFYTPKYIASYYLDPEDGDSGYKEHKYQELCVIDTGAYFGTADEPLSPGKHLWSDAGPTSCSIGHYLDSSLLNCGLTVMYADDMPSYVSCIPDNLVPPFTSGRDTFFQTIRDVYADPPSYSSDNYNECTISDVKKLTIDGHNLEYMELSYTDKAGNEIFDVFSFEKKPLGSAFITEYRCLADEIVDGAGALAYAYGMLRFYKDDFESVAASRYPYSSARIYNGQNTASATIDISGLEPGSPRYSDMRYKNTVSFELGEFGSHGESVCEITLTYRDSNTVERSGGMEAWAQKMIKDESFYGKYSKEIPDGNLTSFMYNGCEAYYLVFSGTEKHYSKNEDVRHHKCRIEMPEGGEIQLDVKFTHDVPENFDVVAFLDEHVAME